MKEPCLAIAFAAGCGAAGPTAVTGIAADFYGQPIPLAQVRIGEQPITTTDATGHFSFANVPATYDATLSVTLPDSVVPLGSPPVRVAIVYRGLKRRDPTLWLP